jgi:1,4-dihydroxy-2-naphthoate octaprenyltransferase
VLAQLSGVLYTFHPKNAAYLDFVDIMAFFWAGLWVMNSGRNPAI